MKQTKAEKVEAGFFLEKYFNVQMGIGIVEKDGKNPHFNSNYATLEGILSKLYPLLKENRLIISFHINKTEDGDYMELAIRDVDSDMCMFFHSPIQACGKNYMQALGSAITYNRRYLLCMAFNIVVDDDDGNDSWTKDPKPGLIKKISDKVDKYEQDRAAKFWDYINTTLKASNLEDLKIQQLKDLLKMI